MESKKFKLDIFELLKNISNSNIGYWDKLKDEQKKAFAPIVINRWLSSKNSFELLMINHIVNRYTFNFNNHKKLLYNLMCICTIPNSRYSWVKREAKSVKYPKSTTMLAKYLEYSLRETTPILHCYTNDELITIAKTLGYQNNVISELKKELKGRHV